MKYPKSRPKNILVICKNIDCREPFLTWPYKLKNGAGRFCSNQCKYGTPESNFFAKVDVLIGPDACWLWTGYTRVKGCGEFRVGRGKYKLAHRASFEIHYGPIPDDIEVCHNCPGGDNPACVNPEHLFLGSHKNNMEDASKKGRLHKRKHLLPELVREIFQAKDTHGLLQYAKRVDMNPQTIRLIWQRKTYCSITNAL